MLEGGTGDGVSRISLLLIKMILSVLLNKETETLYAIYPKGLKPLVYSQNGYFNDYSDKQRV